MNQVLKAFAVPTAVSLVVLFAVFLWGGWYALWIAVLLTILEVTLSFDNAVVNARILTQMDEKWQKRFLTWGILIAVFGTRLVLPIVIVAISVMMNPLEVLSMAINDAEHYGELLHTAHVAIASFGGAFLLMVSLKYFFDSAKDVHWIKGIEEVLARWGRFEAIEIGLTLISLLIISSIVGDAGTILYSGIVGILVFVIMQGIASSFSAKATGAIGGGSVALFLYLNVLDAAFSLDGVVGAFAISNQIPIIVAGLGIGAYFVRALTIYFVQRKTLETLIFLEHGAHWAILGLSLAMLASIFAEVPEVITGLVGLVFVGTAAVSSIRLLKKNKAKEA